MVSKLNYSELGRRLRGDLLYKFIVEVTSNILRILIRIFIRRRGNHTGNSIAQICFSFQKKYSNINTVFEHPLCLESDIIKIVFSKKYDNINTVFEHPLCLESDIIKIVFISEKIQ